jgi:menaquinone-9 beta-reductase
MARDASGTGERWESEAARLYPRGSVTRSADVIIVGAGPAGASTAVYLARSGLDVLVLDRARFPRGKACAECLSPQASRLLDDLGVLSAVERSGAAHLEGIAVRAPDGTWLVGSYTGQRNGRHRPYRPRSLAVRREILDQILVNAARFAGAAVLEGARVTDVLYDGTTRVSGVRAMLRDGSKVELRARLVVAADGLRSTIARRVGLAHVSRYPKRYSLVAHYTGVEGVGPYGEMHVERDGFVGVADVGGGVTTVAMVVPARRAKAMSGDSARFLDDWIGSRRHLAPRFEHATRVGDVWATGPFASQARRAWAPGVALVGDAADFFDPFTGEGIYAALRGGELLAQHVIESLEAMSPAKSDRALRAYDTARRREFGGKWRVEKVIGAVVGVAPLMNRAARALATRRDLADLLVGVTGDFIPARAVLNARYVGALVRQALFAPRVPPSVRPLVP